MTRIQCHLVVPRFVFSSVLAMLCSTWCMFGTAIAATGGDAWRSFLGNRPLEALETFEKLAESDDADVAAAAYRGMSAVHEYLGQNGLSAVSLLRAYEKERDMRTLAARLGPIISWSQLGHGKEASFVQKRIKKVMREQGLFVGGLRDQYLHYLMRVGDLRGAKDVAETIGAVHTWWHIGPFNNISNSGFDAAYPPEHQIDFAGVYAGKDGNKVKWHKQQNRSPSGWLFMENHTKMYNAVNYFYCSVASESEQQVNLSIGASGTFKVFVNGTVVLQDSIFRNTGVDAYIQPVTLRKGTNAVLVKLGHEDPNPLPSSAGMSNFCLRILDEHYEPAEDITCGYSEPGNVTPPPLPANLQHAPVSDSVHSFLIARLEQDTADLEAVFTLASYYNHEEQTDRAQILLNEYLSKYPESSVLHVLLGEALMRAGKTTESQVHIAKAYESCNLTKLGWEQRLESIMEKRNPRTIHAFLDKSPSEFSKSPSAELARFTAYAMTENRAEAVACLTRLEERHARSGGVATVLFSVYAAQGAIDKAANLLQSVLEHNRNDIDYWVLLAKAHLQRGNMGAAREALEDGAQYSPNDPAPWLMLARVLFMQKEFDQALACIDRVLTLRPTDSDALMLKGNAKAAQGHTKEAIAVFEEAIAFTSADHLAYESIRQLKKQPSLESLTPLPDIDSLVSASSAWADTLGENMAVLAYIKDIYYYPSHASRLRTLLVAKPLTQRGIENWHEFVAPHNPSYQVCTINRAVTLTKAGDEVEADIEGYQAVFTSLEPGDIVVVEYELRDYYQGDMAGMVCGSHEFTPGRPMFDSRLRLVMPKDDTIPYHVYGDQVTLSTTERGDYRVSAFTAPPGVVRTSADYVPEDHPSYPKVVYSTFEGWNRIARWYSGIVGHRTRPVIEITRLADTLFAGVESEAEILRCVHDFVKRTINYSFVSFRQSGWVPQQASAVLATRIGDCKDMSTLAKSLLDLGGVDSRLVLVNSDQHLFHDHAYVGPNFDHCIVAAFIDGDTTFVDLTATNNDLASLPWGVQGTMALIIDSSVTELSTLPKESPERCGKRRTVRMVLDSSGRIHRDITTVRYGSMAASMRSSYLFLSEKERRREMTETLSRDYPRVELDTLVFEELDRLSDSLYYRYTYSADDAVDMAGNTAVLALNLPDRATSRDCPSLQDREWPVDMRSSRLELGTWDQVIELTYPDTWKLIDLPENVELSTDRAEYALSFERAGSNGLRVTRHMRSAYDSVYTPEEFAPEDELLKQAVKADDVKLVFKME